MGREMIMELVRLAARYAVVGIAVALAAITIPQRSLNVAEVSALAATAGATFLVLDMFAPAVGMGARKGAGFGIGANLVNAPAVLPGVAAPAVAAIGGGASDLIEPMGEDISDGY